jgi:hypothetical protein
MSADELAIALKKAGLGWFVLLSTTTSGRLNRLKI